MQRSSWTRPTGKTMRDMLHIGAPIFAELFLVSLFVMVDTALLKPCGTTAIAAVGLTAEPINVLEFLFFAVETAVIARMARASAKNDRNAIHAIIRGYLKLTLTSAALLAVLTGAFAIPFLTLFGGTADTLPIAVPYFQISLLAFVCRRMYGAMATILKGLDKPQWSFLLNLIANGINIVGDVVLINGYGPFPKLGALGAAVATVSGCAVGLICAVVVMRDQLRAREIRIPLSDWLRSTWRETRAICTEALPMAGEKVMIRLGIFLSITRIAALGTTAFAAYRILISLQNFAYLGAEAVATTALIFLSKAYANHDRKAAQDAFSAAMVYGLAFSSLCAVLFFAVPGFLMSCYSDDPQVLSEGVRVLRIIFLYQPFQAVALIYAQRYAQLSACGYSLDHHDRGHRSGSSVACLSAGRTAGRVRCVDCHYDRRDRALRAALCPARQDVAAIHRCPNPFPSCRITKKALTFVRAFFHFRFEFVQADKM